MSDETFSKGLEIVADALSAMRNRGVKRHRVAREKIADLVKGAAPGAAAQSARKDSGKAPDVGVSAKPVAEGRTGRQSGAASGCKTGAMGRLREKVVACTKCPHLVESRAQVVFGVGSIDAELMFVGEAPGADEDARGEPFVGRAGELLTRMIKAMGFERDDVFIGNVLKCRPDMPPGSSGNRKPTPEEMVTCLPYLIDQIDLIRPKVLVALGATAVEGLTGESPVVIGKIRGSWREFRGIPLMATYHPAYLLRNQSNTEKRKVWEDMLMVLERLGHPISEKQRGYFLQKG